MHPHKILIADDDIFNQRILKNLVEREGYETIVVSNGAEVLEKLSNEIFALLLLDVRMPIMDGIETTQRIRTGEAGTATQFIPIIGLTALSSANYESTLIEAGMNQVIEKPPRTEVLQQALMKLLPIF